MSFRGEFRDDFGDVRDDFKQLRSDASALIQTLMDAGREGAGKMSRRLLRQTEDWADELKESLRNARDRGREELSELSENIPAKPLLGLLLAVGAGLVIASLLRHRNEHDEIE